MQKYMQNILPTILDNGIIEINKCSYCKEPTTYERMSNNCKIKNILKLNNYLINNNDSEYKFVKFIYNSFNKAYKYGYRDYLSTNEHLNPKYGYSEKVLVDYEIKQHEKNFNNYKYYSINIDIRKFIGFEFNNDDEENKDVEILPYISLLYNTKEFDKNIVHMIIKVKSTLNLDKYKNNITEINDFYTFVRQLNIIANHHLTTIPMNTCQYVRNVVLYFYNFESFKSVVGCYKTFDRIGCTHYRVNLCQIFKISNHIIPDFYRKHVSLPYNTFIFPNNIQHRVSLTTAQIANRAKYFEVLNTMFNNNIKIQPIYNTLNRMNSYDLDNNNDDDDDDNNTFDSDTDMDEVYKPYSSFNKNKNLNFNREEYNIKTRESTSLSQSTLQSSQSSIIQPTMSTRENNRKNKRRISLTLSTTSSNETMEYDVEGYADNQPSTSSTLKQPINSTKHIINKEDEINTNKILKSNSKKQHLPFSMKLRKRKEIKYTK